MTDLGIWMRRLASVGVSEVWQDTDTLWLRMHDGRVYSVPR